MFWSAVRAERPDLHKGFNPWDAITTPESLRALLGAASVPGADVVAEAGTHPLASPAAAWALIMGSGYRGTLEQLSPGERVRLESRYRRDVAAGGVTSIEANVVYAAARKTGS